MKTIGILNNENNYSGNLNEIQIIYVQPKQIEDGYRCVDFQWISKWLDKKYGSGEFESEFAMALKKWAVD